MTGGGGGGGGGGELISVDPEELCFEFEIGKPAYCTLKVVNHTEHHVAFKVKTTSPRKYFVRPNNNVVQPWDSCTVTVTLQAQKEYPVDMQCKDKFLLQSTKVPPSSNIDEIPPNTFNKEGDKVIEELKLRVVYKAPSESVQSDSEPGPTSSGPTSSRGRSDSVSPKNSSAEEVQAVHLKKERDTALQLNKQLQRELEMLKKHKSRKGDAGFSLTFTAFAGLVSLLFGFILNLALSTPSTR